MKLIDVVIYSLLATAAAAQSTFSVTGTQIPADVMRVNYGKLPSSLEGFDLNICNESGEKRSVTASAIYQALAESNLTFQPLGRQIMLAMIMQNQNHSAMTLLSIAVNSTVGVLSILGAGRTGVSSNILAGTAVGAAVGQQLLNNLKPVLTADQVQRYESQVLEPALVLDSGSCVERTIFVRVVAPGTKTKFESLRFHVR